MKTLISALIIIYQSVLSPLFNQLLGVNAKCRYSPTCSEYAKNVIKKYGILRGGALAIKRFLSCQPFTKNKYGTV